MKVLNQVIITFFLAINILGTPSVTFANADKLEFKSELSQLQENTEFKILLPENFSKWNLILKPLSYKKESIQSVLITFTDINNKDKYLFECIQSAASNIPEEKGEEVVINQMKGKFTAWAESRNNPNPSGGILKWTQEGTKIELKSAYLSKEEMIQIAKDMK